MENSKEDQLLLIKAVDIVFTAGVASVSILQRRLIVGYPQAAKMIDQMQSLGIVGPFEGSLPRKILLSESDWTQMKKSYDFSHIPDLQKPTIGPNGSGVSAKAKSGLSEETIRFVPAKCPSCGGSIDIDLHTKSTVCEYCGTKVLMTGHR
ncbi:MAG: DNA translocase FtsK [Eubacteriales bacterium]